MMYKSVPFGQRNEKSCINKNSMGLSHYEIRDLVKEKSKSMPFLGTSLVRNFSTAKVTPPTKHPPP